MSINKKQKKNRISGGFTLAELLVVVAIIAVLVAVAIPVFSEQLEKSREATDMANIRGAYAEVVVEAISDNSVTRTVSLKQKNDGWDVTGHKDTLESLGTVEGEPAEGGTCMVSWAESKAKFSFSEGSAGEDSKSSAAPVATRNALIESIARGLSKGMKELIPAGREAQADSCLHKDSYTAANGDFVVVKELAINANNLENGGVYWNPGKYTWGQLLEEAGVDLSNLGEMNGYVYLDDDYNPISMSYYDEDGKYCYTFMDDGTTYTMDRMPGERQHAGYYKEYAKSLAK